MRKIGLYCSLLLISVISFGQGSQDFVAMLFSLDGEGEYTRDGNSEVLIVPQNYKKGDKILLSSGTATLMLFSGDEVNLKANEEYTVSGTSENISGSEKSSAFANVTGC